MTTARIVLVLGATGGSGSAIASALAQHGWTVRGLVRDATRPHLDAGIEWHEGDAMNATDVANAARGVSVIVHAVNPPGYRNWNTLVLPMLDNTIAAARKNNARIVLPGTVYNFGPDALPLLSEVSPQRPLTRKGAIRVQMENRLAAAATNGVRVLILRCGDFFGPRTGNNWFSAIVKPGKKLSSVSYPGQRDLPHAWAYLPDIGKTIALLLERENELTVFERFHFGGHWVDSNVLMFAIRKAAADSTLPLRSFPWWLITLASPFVTSFREMREMRYLWRKPLQLDNRRLVAFLGAEPHTRLDAAVADTLRGMGCL
jgi:nucleoside-diphosphate-sugar epimerase